MKKLIVVLSGFLLFAGNINAGNGDLIVNGKIGVGTATPAASAAIDVSSTTSGFLPPRLTAAQRDAIANPAQGLLIFNTTDNTYDYHTGSAWMALGSWGGLQHFSIKGSGGNDNTWSEVVMARIYISSQLPKRLPIGGYLRKACNDTIYTTKVRFRIDTTYTETPDPSASSNSWVAVTNYFPDISPWYGQYVDLYLQLNSGDNNLPAEYGTTVSPGSNACCNCIGLSITTSSPLPDGVVGSAYNQTLAASGGTPPYAWSIVTGSLPAGLSLNQNTGQISGTPTTAGAGNFTVRVTDNNNNTSDKQFSMTVNPAPGLSVTDNFNRPNETPLAGSWTSPDNEGTRVNLSSNRVVSSAATNNAYSHRNSESYTGNQYSQAKLVSSVSAAEVGGPAVRSSLNGSAWNGYFATLYNSSTAGIYVVYGSGWTYEQVGADCPGSFAQTDTFKLGISGNVLTLYRNGNSVCSRTDSNNRISSGGAPGIMIYGQGAWDDWEGGDL
ncbi:MAG: Ig domain-containing protein [Deltaproteobacteria bacterium]|nr:Ig domain-containing protein [Deltaproteobacteria bacterium]